MLKGKERDKWLRALSNEIGRLAQGNDFGVVSTDTIEFILRSDIPPGQDITYATFVCDHRPLKDEKWRVRCVVGGDKLTYPGDPASPAASLLDTKLILNSTISDAHRGAKFLSADLKDHFLASPMDRPEYMRIPLDIFPPDIISKYNLDRIAHNGYVYIKIKRACMD